MRNIPTRTCRRGLVVVSRYNSTHHGCICYRCPSISPVISTHTTGLNHHNRVSFLSRSIHDTSILSMRQNDQALDGSSDNDARSAEAPPAPEGKLSIVFTDIVESTQLWEKDSEAMAKAMQTHDKVMRSLTERHQGYEVKQNGDGFMIAFPTSITALQFCLDVQQQFLDQTWPEQLLKLPPSKETSDEDGHVLFRGLRLRMGAHWGTPVRVWNRVINRMDYLGPMVNRAARFVEVTEGGQIVVSEEFLLEVQKTKREGNNDTNTTTANTDEANNQSDQEVSVSEQQQKHQKAETDLDLEGLHCKNRQKGITDQKFEVRLLGEHQFKGISQPQKLYFIIPESLHGRLNSWPRHKHVPGSKGNIIP